MTFTISRRVLSLLSAIILAGAAVALGFSPQASHAQAAGTAPAAFEDKAVYHVDDPAAMRLALGNIGNHLVASPQAKISLVANGKGIATLAAGEYSKQIADLQAKGVRFVACNNSMKAFDIDASKLVPGVVVVPAGVAELSRLQVAEHYAYIKP
jgi:intracellular sulfur oxidation DsrE/DsrF family protein